MTDFMSNSFSAITGKFSKDTSNNIVIPVPPESFELGKVRSINSEIVAIVIDTNLLVGNFGMEWQSVIMQHVS